jgi:hypothetical protein
MFRHQEFLALLLSLEPLLTIDSKFDNRARLLPSKAEGRPRTGLSSLRRCGTRYILVSLEVGREISPRLGQAF